MYNNWLTIGKFTIHGYGAMIAIGILSAFALEEKLAKKKGLDTNKIDNMIFFVIIFGYACAKILYCLVEWKRLIADPLSVLGSSGFVVYGGIIGGILAVKIYTKMQGWKFFDFMNMLVPGVALAQGFGRIGCFFAGCCYGKETTGPLYLIFPEGSLAPAGVKLIPTQLFSSAFDFCLFFFLYHEYTKGKHPEDTAGWYLILYSVGRFFIEFLRGDVRGNVVIFSTSQFISFFMLIYGAWLIWHRQQEDEKKEALEKAE